MPDLGFTGNQVRCYACIRNRKLLEICGILIADRKRTDKVADVLSEYISRRKASEQVLLEEVRTGIIIRTDVQHLMLMHGIISILIHHLHPIVVLLIVERDGQHVFFLIFCIGI